MQNYQPFFSSDADFHFFSDLPTTETAITPKLEATKESIKQFSEQIKNNILEGFISPEQALLAKKLILDAIESAFAAPDVKATLEAGILKYPNGKASYKGAEISLQSRKSYNYGPCIDPVYTRLKEEIKQREQFLQSLKEPLTYVDELTGEAVTVYPALSNSTSYFTVKVKP